ncbi:hypothetical protein E2C01_030577 [Portunus trituberculatus]|uniref:Uncharacterized protein n=1 Tax=Portunus trituberculatus TaxID=210409 RepID=A0A5B7EW46_PORTR|nr:hypothetical protein [Portunus trituberculatus]
MSYRLRVSPVTAKRFDRLTRQFAIHISRTTHQVKIHRHPKFIPSPPDGSVNRHYPVRSVARLCKKKQIGLLLKSMSC